jgi:hypothetical protein
MFPLAAGSVTAPAATDVPDPRALQSKERFIFGWIRQTNECHFGGYSNS